jgi:hypothetical protein
MGFNKAEDKKSEEPRFSLIEADCILQTAVCSNRDALTGILKRS